jgi:SAM-dependent methyltransferase
MTDELPPAVADDAARLRDPLADSSWSRDATVAGFASAAPNARLLEMAAAARQAGARRLLDIGCGAGRNAVPLARLGWQVLGVDLSLPMITAAARRAAGEPGQPRLPLQLALAPMDHLPVRDAAFDVVVAHGIWNLARSGDEFRQGMAEAARAARRGGALFLFTFSRTTLADDAEPVAGESFVFTQFSGEPQCFVTERQVLDELAAHGFVPDPRERLRELNRPRPGALRTSPAPVIYEGLFRRG